MMTVRITSHTRLLALLMALMFAPLAPAMIGVEEAPASSLEPVADLSELLDMDKMKIPQLLPVPKEPRR